MKFWCHWPTLGAVQSVVCKGGSCSRGEEWMWQQSEHLRSPRYPHSSRWGWSPAGSSGGWSWGAHGPAPRKQRGDAHVWACMFWLWQHSQNARAYRSIADNVEFEVLHQFFGVGLLEEEVLLLLWQPTDGCVCGPEECDGFVDGIVDQPKQVVFLQHSKNWGRRFMLCSVTLWGGCQV